MTLSTKVRLNIGGAGGDIAIAGTILAASMALLLAPIMALSTAKMPETAYALYETR